MSIPISLPDLADYAASKSGDPVMDPTERHLWEQIAAEVGAYLHTADEPALFDHTQGDPT